MQITLSKIFWSPDSMPINMLTAPDCFIFLSKGVFRWSARTPFGVSHPILIFCSIRLSHIVSNRLISKVRLSSSKKMFLTLYLLMTCWMWFKTYCAEWARNFLPMCRCMEQKQQLKGQPLLVIMGMARF